MGSNYWPNGGGCGVHVGADLPPYDKTRVKVEKVRFPKCEKLTFAQRSGGPFQPESANFWRKVTGRRFLKS